MTSLVQRSSHSAARLTDISSKPATLRQAVATGRIDMTVEAAVAIRDGLLQKGDVLAAARIAGIMAVKRTGDVVPLCHDMLISGAEIDLTIDAGGVTATAVIRAEAETGLETHAIHAVTTALLTIFDMARSIDPDMRMVDIHTVTKASSPNIEPY